MPSCKNGTGSYKGTEPSPKGRGFCARHEKIGTKKRGTNKKMWVVRSVKLSSGKHSKRWFKVLPKAKKSTKTKTKTTTKTKKKKKTKTIKKIKGGEKRPAEHERILQMYLGQVEDKHCKAFLRALYRSRDDLLLPITKTLESRVLELGGFSNEQIIKRCVPHFVHYLKTHHPHLFGARHATPTPKHTPRSIPPQVVIHDMRGHAYIIDIVPDERIIDTLVVYGYTYGHEEMAESNKRLIGKGAILWTTEDLKDRAMIRMTWRQLSEKYDLLVPMHIVYV